LFRLDEKYYDPSNPSSQILLFNSGLTSIDNCTFELDNPAYFLDLGHPIVHGFNSFVRFRENNIDLWYEGIYLKNSIAFPSRITDNTFDGVLLGVDLRTSSSSIGRNDFDIYSPYITNNTLVGTNAISVTNRSEFLIFENEIISTLDPIGISQADGILLANTRDAPNWVLNNSVEDTRNAISISSNNGTAAQGTIIECNIFETQEINNVFMSGISTIFATQGSSSTPAGNSFSINCPNSLSHWREGIHRINYFYDAVGSRANPTCSDVIRTPINVSNSRCADPRLILSEDPSESVADYEVLHSNIQPLINGAQSQMNNSSNPSAAYIDAQGRLGQLLTEESEIINGALYLLFSDSTTADSTKMKWLTRKRGETGAFATLEYLEATNQQSVFNTAISSTSTSFPNVQFTSNLGTYEDLVGLIFNIRNSGRSVADANQIEKDSLCFISNLNSGFASQKALGILQFFYADYLDLNSCGLGTPLPMQATSIKDENSAIREYTNTISPNPVQATLHLNRLEPELTSTYHIFDVNGKQMLTGLLAPSDSEIRVDNLNSGLYFLTIIDAGHRETIKFTKL